MRNLAIRSAMLATSKSFPWDYRVEYVECSGNQVADSEVDARYGIAVEAEWCKTTSQTDNAICGAKGYQNNRCVPIAIVREAAYSVIGVGSGDTDAYTNNESTSLTTVGVYYNTYFNLSIGSFVTRFNGTQYSHNLTTQSAIDTGTTLRIFAREWNGNINAYASARIKYMKIWLDNALVREYIPCVKNGIVCMYDTVGKTFLYNQTSTPLIAGPVVNDNGTVS